MKILKILLVTTILMIVMLQMETGCYYDSKEKLYSSTFCDTTNVSYTRTIGNILNLKCTMCHGVSNPSAGISLTSYNLVKAAALNGSLLGTTNEIGGFKLMPPDNKLDNCSLKQIDKWIRLGMPQ
jgi:hypothetical protein